MLVLTTTWCGKPPNFPWRGTKSNWDDERSNQIRIGEAICPGFEALNPVRLPLFDTQESKDARAKYLADKKKAKNPKVAKPEKKALEHLSASGVGLADFM